MKQFFIKKITIKRNSDANDFSLDFESRIMYVCAHSIGIFLVFQILRLLFSENINECLTFLVRTICDYVISLKPATPPLSFADAILHFKGSWIS